jgi:hypothetical protein
METQPRPTELKNLRDYEFVNGGITMRFEDGSFFHEQTPRDMATLDHLATLKARYVIPIYAQLRQSKEFLA